MSRTLWRFVDRAILPSEHIEAKVMEFLRKGILTKRQTINGQGQELVMTELNPAHPWWDALPGFAGHLLDFDVAEDEFQVDEYEDDFVPAVEIEDPRGQPRQLDRTGRLAGSAVVSDRGFSQVRAGDYCTLPPRATAPAIDDVSIADDDQLVGEVDGGTDVVRDDLDPIANVEAALIGRERHDAMFLAEAGDRRARVSDDIAMSGVAGAGIKG